MLSYQLEMVGIKVIITEESYTSKASFLDKDCLPIYQKDKKNQVTFSGKTVRRTQDRGLYRKRMRSRQEKINQC
ncbi:MAG: hypothetical protein AB4062_03830 [Crocosphaera sp.]